VSGSADAWDELTVGVNDQPLTTVAQTCVPRDSLGLVDEAGVQRNSRQKVVPAGVPLGMSNVSLGFPSVASATSRSSPGRYFLAGSDFTVPPVLVFITRYEIFAESGPLFLR
jgi:hypothetical protein